MNTTQEQINVDLLNWVGQLQSDNYRLVTENTKLLAALKGMNDPKYVNTLAAIGERLRTQDNRITVYPMFCVQVKKRDYGYDPLWCDETVWIDEGIEVPKDTPEANEIGFVDRWETVMVAFTEEGCKEYIKLNGHNHTGEKRIYVASFYRCPEMIAIREALINV